MSQTILDFGFTILDLPLIRFYAIGCCDPAQNQKSHIYKISSQFSIACVIQVGAHNCAPLQMYILPN
ncbi:hypothetical protein C7Y66_12580 [Chroococcidiopsis sp. CCALA 051]|uniref:hypothetical protein n=1 Tax=Chroococcidiopsis sp. CCALA 051 TaxID=869949 RepID=UPI000D0CD676|nr:hypothetical protein [Chroococcidiopsis sp. CCALA 051]MBE9015268.1 hypothetical protein [Chroococcidiopsidales cyanobacterium LEGE 13417]PSM48832.1 hypothetical protein C7Y66_12580 [Chroococcidiopsis sp. CCALA 051]